MAQVTIYCIEGCHGSGKTNIIETIKKLGHPVLDENFIGMPQLGLRPQSFTMELIWICKWFERALRLKNMLAEGGATLVDTSSADSPVLPRAPTVYFADRSPYSAILYAEWGLLLKPIIAQNLVDLSRAGICIKNIYVHVDSTVLWNRISARLRVEPERSKYNENSPTHMENVCNFYQSHSELWHYTVDNTTNSIDATVGKILNIAGMSTL